MSQRHTLVSVLLFTLCLGTAEVSPHAEPVVRQKLLFDFGWRFHFGDAASPERDFRFGIRAAFAKAAAGLSVAQIDFNDSDWTPVNLPHDWAVQLDFVKSDDYAVKSRRLFNGKCQVIVQATRSARTITLKAAADGLKPALLNITAEPSQPRPFVP